MGKTPEQLADEIIKELTEAGLTPDQMLEVIALARIKYENLKRGNEHNCNQGD